MNALLWQALEGRVNAYRNPRQASTDATNDTVLISERNVLLEVSEPGQCHEGSDHTSVIDMYVA